MRLFPEEVRKISLLIHHSDLGRVIDALAEKGIIHLVDASADLDRDVSIDDRLMEIISYENRLKKVISILRPYHRKVSGIRAVLSPPEIEKVRVKRRDVRGILKDVESKLEGVERKVLEIEGRLKRLDERIKANEAIISRLSNIQFLDFDLSYAKESDYITLKAGICKEIDPLKEEIEGIGGVLDFRQTGRGKERKWVVVALVHRSREDELKEIWSRYVEEIEIPRFHGKPSDMIKELKEEISQARREIDELRGELKKIADASMLDLLVSHEEILIERLKLEARKNFGKTERTYLIEGWVLKEKLEELIDSLEHLTKGRFAYTISNPSGNPEEPPTYIKTGPLTKPFKPLLTLFGLPKYREINPLIFLVLWFPMMFGFMLGDMGYGLIIFFLSLFALLKFGKRSERLKDWSIIGLSLGFWTILFGYLSNGFFGDLLPRYFNGSLPRINLFGVDLPIDGLRNPLTFLEIALIMGLIHLNLGIALGIYQDLKNNRIRNMICGKISFIILQLFGGALIGEYLLKIWTLSTTFKTISYLGTLVGILLLVIEAKGMAFLEIMGFVGDWLSYARLLALGLATAGMALAFNIVAQLFGEMIHVVVSVLILVVAHVVTMGLNSLGAAVHSLRLQYVEFFNRFYEGGGRAFAPLKAKRKYTELV